MTVPGLSTVVYASDGRIPRSHARPDDQRSRRPAPAAESRGRMHVAARRARLVVLRGDLPAPGRATGGGSTIGTDDSAPYQVFDDVSDAAHRAPGALPRGRPRQRRPHPRHGGPAHAGCPAPTVTITSPADGGRSATIDPVTLTAAVDPERPPQSVDVPAQRRRRRLDHASARTRSSPAYTATDDVSALPLGTSVRYRAVLREPALPRSPARPVTVTTALPQPRGGSVTVAGSLQSELGCPADWQPGLRGHPPGLRHLGRAVARHLHAARPATTSGRSRSTTRGP